MIQLGPIASAPAPVSPGVKKEPAEQAGGAFAALLAMLLVQPGVSPAAPDLPTGAAAPGPAAAGPIQTIPAPGQNPAAAAGAPGAEAKAALPAPGAQAAPGFPAPDAAAPAQEPMTPDGTETAMQAATPVAVPTTAATGIPLAASAATSAPAQPAAALPEEPATDEQTPFPALPGEGLAAHPPEVSVREIEPGQRAQLEPERKPRQAAPAADSDTTAPDWVGQAAPQAPATDTGVFQADAARGLPTGRAVHVDQVMAEVARLVRTSPDGVHSVTLHLHPEHLGEVKLHLNLAGTDVQTVFEVGTAEAGRALELRGDQLRSGLAEAGLSLSGFTVSTGLGARSQTGREAEADRLAGRRPQTRAGATPAGGVEAVRRFTGSQPRTSGLDIIA